MIFQSKRDVEKLVDEINEGRPQCPVGLNTLVIPRKVTLNEHMNQPYVYLNCGHVQGKPLNIFFFFSYFPIISANGFSVIFFFFVFFFDLRIDCVQVIMTGVKTNQLVPEDVRCVWNKVQL